MFQFVFSDDPDRSQTYLHHYNIGSTNYYTAVFAVIVASFVCLCCGSCLLRFVFFFIFLSIFIFINFNVLFIYEIGDVQDNGGMMRIYLGYYYFGVCYIYVSIY